MKVLVAACGYFLIILAGVVGVVAFAAHHDYQTLAEAMADLPDLWTAVKWFVCTLVVIGLMLVWEWYSRASRGE
ncbi:hypothetical protein [Pseudomonas sp. PDM25]|uniref:hypothetical protein n=1 Tax=Pseudomonas sp. PDM25 TaxID=2854772 RepID=UPI001C475ECE|nr:hypothetical protein [Pseudomonas sp. PDM25]MBV7514571.1 hypothetical protein [Pseudomonas sp. PDM25]